MIIIRIFITALFLSIGVVSVNAEGLTTTTVKQPELSPELMQKYLELQQQQGQKKTTDGQPKLPEPAPAEIVKKDPDPKQQQLTPQLQQLPPPVVEPSKLEKAFLKQSPTMLDAQKSDEFPRSLKQFGYDFFSNSGQLAQAIETLPDSSEYVLGPGDVVSLSVWGAVDLRQELSVDRNGELMIPRVGLVRVWGLTLDKAKASTKDAIGRLYRNFDMNFTLSKLRSVQIYVVGEVEKPGRYYVSAQGTIINALAAAGGPTRNGSLRSIRVTRGVQTLETVDLYDMFLSGDRSKDVRLQNGDTIFVSVIGSVVAVAGEVRRPAIYELKGKTPLLQMLQMAGGVAASGSLGRIQVERLENNSKRILLDVVLTKGLLTPELESLELKDRDMVKVFPVQATMRQLVLLKGNVQQPGEYQYRNGMRLNDLIPSTQFLLPESYLDSVEITRISPPDYRRELITVSLRRALAGNQADNILLQEQDAVKVFSRFDMEEKPKVSVSGAVVTPGQYDYIPGMSVRDLVTAAGSAKRNAFLDNTELSRIIVKGDRAEPQRVQLDLGKALAGDPAHNLLLQGNDVLIVRSVTNWEEAADKFIVLKGEVKFPGSYSIAPYEKLSSVIERAGGYTEKAYLSGAKFTRQSVREQQQKRMEDVINRSEKDIMQKQTALMSGASSKEELDATKAALDGLQKSVEGLKKLKAEGRVVVKLAALDELKKGSYDLTLEGGDQLDIPTRPSVVNVLGQVYNPTSFIYQPGKDADTYLQYSGGALNDAETAEMYIIRADGTVLSRQQASFGIHWSEDGKRWTIGSFLATPLDAGDTLVVPQKLDKVAWVREIKDWTQILANIAVTAGTVIMGLR